MNNQSLLCGMLFRLSFAAGPLLVALITLSPATEAANFRSSDQTIETFAERSRSRSALFWTSRELPGRWGVPCSIEIYKGPQPACGRAHFRFQENEVFDWQLIVCGNRREILENVIPREVDRMVRASIIRSPVLPWLDEGSAALFESRSAQEHLRAISKRTSLSIVNQQWLECADPPACLVDQQHLAAIGFSIVEVLLKRGTPSQLIEFQASRSSIPERLNRYYGLTVETLRDELRGRFLDHSERINHEQSPPVPQQTLVIWTAEWCEPCRRFEAEVLSNFELMTTLKSLYRIEVRNIDRSADQAQAELITSVPTFVLGTQRFAGYTTPADFLQRLHSLRQSMERLSSPSTGTIAPKIEEPTTSDFLAPAPPELKNQPHGPLKSIHWPQLPDSWIRDSLALLQLTGVVSGVFATGGLGGAVLIWGIGMLRASRHIRRRISSQDRGPSERSAAVPNAPFPRELDEAGELLELRQSEGRVATLDAIRGMFLDDELQKLEQAEGSEAQLAKQLRKQIDQRVEEVAPLTTRV
ncbi:thioredoxin family protein [Planctomicrobium sp. SH668]|uniref:thioredoxin family protein n=1 Tax=Planctomicrobium sp. SH668 TaxID=3448126 RepID=UPI003F5B30AC